MFGRETCRDRVRLCLSSDGEKRCLRLKKRRSPNNIQTNVNKATRRWRRRTTLHWSGKSKSEQHLVFAELRHLEAADRVAAIINWANRRRNNNNNQKHRSHIGRCRRPAGVLLAIARCRPSAEICLAAAASLATFAFAFAFALLISIPISDSTPASIAIQFRTVAQFWSPRRQSGGCEKSTPLASSRRKCRCLVEPCGRNCAL